MAENTKKNNDSKQLKQIAEELKTQNQINNQTQDDIQSLNNIAKGNERLEFQKEQEFDLEMNLMKEQNYILENILEAIEEGTEFERDSDDDKPGIFSKFGNLFAGIGLFEILKKGFAGLFIPIFKTLLSPKGLLGIGKKMIKFIGAPIAAVLGILDFTEGWGNAEEIVGRSGLAAKYQAGFSQLVSGLTLGIIDPKTISQSLDTFNDWMFSNITLPTIEFVKSIPERLMKLPQTIREGVETFLNSEFWQSIISSDLVSDSIEKAKTVFDLLKEKIQLRIIDPIIEFYQKIVDTFNSIVDSVVSIKQNIENAITDKIDKVKDFFGFGDEQQLVAQPTNNVPKEMIKQNIRESSKTYNTNKTEQTTNNNVISQNSRTVINQGNDLSTRSDDIVNQSPVYGW